MPRVESNMTVPTGVEERVWLRLCVCVRDIVCEGVGVGERLWLQDALGVLVKDAVIDCVGEYVCDPDCVLDIEPDRLGVLVGVVLGVSVSDGVSVTEGVCD